MDDDVIGTRGDGEAYTESVGSKLSGAEAKSAAATFRMGTTAGAGLGKMAKQPAGSPMPKQEAGESPSAYSDRLRKWREARPDIEGQKKALLGMGAK